MLGRIFRLLERIGNLILKIIGLSGNQLEAFAYQASAQFRTRLDDSNLIRSESIRAENQIRSLSGLIVILLASVALLVFAATNPQVRNPVINVFTADLSPTQSADSPVQAPAQVDVNATPNTQLLSRGTLVFSMEAGAQMDLFALSAGASEPVRLTYDPADDRYPAWGPDGEQIAFSSRRNGSWDLYLLGMQEGDLIRLTRDLAFESKPSWSPDGEWLVYEGYYEDNLDIYIIRVNGGQDPIPVTRHPEPDFDPAWTSDQSGPYGRSIAFVSRRGGSQDIYLLSLDAPDQIINVTNTPDIDEHSPTWGPGGTLLAYTAVENGISLVYVQDLTQPDQEPSVVGQGRYPTWSPDGSSLVFLIERFSGSLLLSGQYGTWDTSVQTFALPAHIEHPDWTLHDLPEQLKGVLAFSSTTPIAPAYEEPLWPRANTEEPYRLINLPGVKADAPLLSDRVDMSFVALKEHINSAAGWDFLGRLDDVWWSRDFPVEPGQDNRNWHKAGRAFDVVQTYNEGSPAQIELIPYWDGPDLYWELYIRCAVQDGSLGEPLYGNPWDFSARTSGDLAAYEAGGRYYDTVPVGYYVNFTKAAKMFGWEPTPSASSWRYNWPGVLYWQYIKRDGLDWWTAMRELYTEEELQQTFYTPTPLPPTDGGILTPVDPEDSDADGQQAPTPTPTIIVTPGGPEN